MRIGFGEAVNAWTEQFGLIGLLLWVALLVLLPIAVGRAIARPSFAYPAAAFVYGAILQIPVIPLVGFDALSAFWLQLLRSPANFF